MSVPRTTNGLRSVGSMEPVFQEWAFGTNATFDPMCQEVSDPFFACTYFLASFGSFCSSMRKCLKEINETFDLAYSPENLRLGEAIQCYLNPGRIILGTADKETEITCKKLFSQIPSEVQCMNLESAEMVKHGINSFLSMSIVFANHLSKGFHLRSLHKIFQGLNDLVLKYVQSNPIYTHSF